MNLKFKISLFWLQLALFISLIWTGPTLAQVTGFSDGPVKENMVKAVETFNEIYGEDVVIESIRYAGTVSDILSTVDGMIQQGVFLDTDPETQKVRPKRYIHSVWFSLYPEKANRLKENLRLNLNLGDYLISILLKDQMSGATYNTLDSMRPNGRVFSGIFLGSTRGAPGPITRAKVPNTNCDTRVLTTYLFGDPAESIKVCTRAFCEGTKCLDCLVTEITPFAGFFAELETRPRPSEVPTNGRIVQNCCFGGVSYAWATGFTSVEVEADGVSLKVVGRVGQGTNGFFSVPECCDASEPPITEDTTAPGPGLPGILAKKKLSYPSDCNHNTLRRAGNKGGCSTTEGSNHLTVKKDDQTITQIPHTVRSNGTCRSIITILNEQCLAGN